MPFQRFSEVSENRSLTVAALMSGDTSMSAVTPIRAATVRERFLRNEATS
jgi:hypothetical protein